MYGSSSGSSTMDFKKFFFRSFYVYYFLRYLFISTCDTVGSFANSPAKASNEASQKSWKYFFLFCARWMERFGFGSKQIIMYGSGSRRPKTYITKRGGFILKQMTGDNRVTYCMVLGGSYCNVGTTELQTEMTSGMWKENFLATGRKLENIYLYQAKKPK